MEDYMNYKADQEFLLTKEKMARESTLRVIEYFSTAGVRGQRLTDLARILHFCDDVVLAYYTAREHAKELDAICLKQRMEEGSDNVEVPHYLKEAVELPSVPAAGPGTSEILGALASENHPEWLVRNASQVMRNADKARDAHFQLLHQCLDRRANQLAQLHM